MTPPAPARAEARGAGETPADAEAIAVVEKLLVRPLGEKEARRNRFSRAYIPPHARRVRILDQVRSTDSRGAVFVAFAVDDRSGSMTIGGDRGGSSLWRRDTIVGCVYPSRNEIFIKRGAALFAAELLLGKKTPAAGETVCRPAPTTASR